MDRNVLEIILFNSNVAATGSILNTLRHRSQIPCSSYSPLSRPPPILTSKISFVRKKSFLGKSFSFWCKLIVGVVFFSVICLFGQKVNATDYHVGTTQTYTTLEALRTATITWDNNDKIILHNDDNSLADAFNFNSKSITIGSVSDSVTVSLYNTSGVRLSYASNDTLLTIADGIRLLLMGSASPLTTAT
jgi:hypothetical protein